MGGGPFHSPTTLIVLPLALISHSLALLLTLCISLLLTPTGLVRAAAAEARGVGTPREQVIREIEQRELWNEAGWYALLHLTSSPSDTHHRSLVTGREFFLSNAESIVPRDELLTTVTTWFDEAGSPGARMCQFPARALWLRGQLSPGARELLPALSCPDFEQWSHAIAGEAVTLIFPSYFVNNPASAFGHTLIRIDSPRHGREAPLLSYSANFAAHIDPTDNSIVYALKGIFGGYYGFFTVDPYYKKVQQYNDLEDRDVWEYKLNFSQEEVDLLVAHLWEIKRIPFGYYYFDENCSYALLSLLEVARPTLQLTRPFSSWVLPVDTVRVMSAEAGLLTGVTFRPSKARVLASLAERSGESVAKQSYQLVNGEISLEQATAHFPSAPEKAALLDLAYEYTNYLILSTPERSEQLRRLAHASLSARSTLTAPPPPPPTRPAVRPEQGHASQRFSVGTGLEDGSSFGVAEWRAVYHERLDPPAGYLPGAEMVIGRFRFRYQEGDGVDLEGADLLQATSLAPRSEFVRPISWKLAAGARTRNFAKSRRLLGYLEGGIGATEELFETLAYSLATVTLEATNAYEDDFAAAPGVESGMLYNVSEEWGGEVRGWYDHYVVGDSFSSYGAEVEVRRQISDSTALRVALRHERDVVETLTSATVLVDVYF